MPQKNRKDQNAAYVEEMAANNAAIEILNIAKTRLNQFYNPKSAPKSQLQLNNAHPDAPATVAPTDEGAGTSVEDAFSFLQASDQHTSARAEPPPAPDTWGASGAKGDSGGIFAMLDTILKDTEKQVVESEHEEKDAQFEYEQFMSDSSAKHAAEAKAISAKESAKAAAEEELQTVSKELTRTVAEADANAEYLQGLHKECDWLLENHKVREQARTEEIGSLRQAKNVLMGADAKEDSFLQLKSQVRHHLRRQPKSVTSG